MSESDPDAGLDGRFPAGIGTVAETSLRTTPQDEAYLDALEADLDTTRSAVLRAGLRALAAQRDLTVDAPAPDDDDRRADGGRVTDRYHRLCPNGHVVHIHADTCDRCGSAETVGCGPMADGSGVPVTTGDLDLDARPVTVTLHRVATRRGDDQYHVAFRDAAVYEFAHPPSRGSAAEWVEHHVFSHAPDARFEALTPECDREHEAPAIGTVYVRDGRLVGLALDADALAPRVATDGSGHSTAVNQLKTAAENGTLPEDLDSVVAHDCPAWPDRATVHIPVDQSCEDCGWTPGDGGDR